MPGTGTPVGCRVGVANRYNEVKEGERGGDVSKWSAIARIRKHCDGRCESGRHRCARRKERRMRSFLNRFSAQELVAFAACAGVCAYFAASGTSSAESRRFWVTFIVVFVMRIQCQTLFKRVRNKRGGSV